MPITEPITIPQFITVHLGEPNEDAENVTLFFKDYIKNVASSELYPTWPPSALRANILAQITFALNRIYTERYRSQGYNFDITSSAATDQKFIKNREFFESISNIVDEVFDNYIVKQGSIFPYFTSYCDGKKVQCEGLSQWGTVDLANQGLLPYNILQNYYGTDIDIVKDAPIRSPFESYPGRPIKIGDMSEEVIVLQRELNRIAKNYPSINEIYPISGHFDLKTEASVKKFQEIFDLPITGIVDKSTWYRIKSIYVGVRGLSELYQEIISLNEVQRKYPKMLQEGDQSIEVKMVQYFINVIGYFDEDIPEIAVDGIFGPKTKAAVLAFQKEYNLQQDGIIGRETWNKMQDIYESVVSKLTRSSTDMRNEIYPGKFLAVGFSGDDVRDLQYFLMLASENDPSIPMVQVTGTFDEATKRAVEKVQEQNNIPVNGIVGPISWDTIVKLSKKKSQ